MSTTVYWPFADVALARRLEGAEGRANVESVAARARLAPGRGAASIEAGGAWAMFDGADSPLTQTFGLGLFGAIGAAEMSVIEGFYAERGAPVFHEVCPLADQGLIALLNRRGYEPLEFTSVLFQPIAPGLALAAPALPEGGESVRVSLVQAADHVTWARTAAEGWSEFPELAGFMRDIGEVTIARSDAYCFLATLGSQPIATGVLGIQEGVALLAGASTVPSGRRKGAQLALLEARLRFAADRGCDLATIAAAPGSASQRNAERHGFRVAYTRLKWRKR